MAEKGFGVKEINLVGATGTPTIESPKRQSKFKCQQRCDQPQTQALVEPFL